MAWTSPRTWVTDELVTAALLNQQLRDNMLALYYQPTARVLNTANISVPNAAWTALTFNTERYDTEPTSPGMYTAASPTILTCKSSGFYLIVGNAQFALNATGYRGLGIMLNNTAAIAFTRVAAISNADTVLSIAAVWPMAPGDFVMLFAEQTSGAALNINANPAISPEFLMHKIGG